MTRRDKVLVVGNTADPDAGYVGDRLAARGLILARAWREDVLRGTVPRGTAAVLLLGSDWSVAAPLAPDALAAECALVRSARDRAVPLLGLCYGAQVLAHTYGGLVSMAPSPEVGLVTVESVDEGLVAPGPWWAFHEDVIEAPPTARVVARNARGVQAFEVSGALGVQFHPEVRPEVLAGWLSRAPSMVAAAGASGGELAADAVRREADARDAAYALVDGFLARFGVLTPEHG